MADILTAVLIPLVGVLVTFYPPSDDQKLWYVAGFVALSFLAIVLMRRQRAGTCGNCGT